MAWVGAGVGAVVVSALLITLAFGGVGTFTSVPPAAAVTFGQATTLARSDLGAGSWSLVAAFGADLWNGTTLPSTTGTYPANCTVRTQPSPPPELSIPPYRGNLSNGVAVLWVLEYVQPATNTLAAVLVNEGVVSDVATFSGPECLLVPAVLPTAGWTPVDSPVAAQAIYSSGGAAYLSAHREGASLLMTLFPTFPVNGSVGPSSPSWLFGYTPCDGLLQGNLSGPANGTAFIGIVNATTGEVDNTTSTPADCASVGPPPPGIQSVFFLGVPGLTIGSGQGGTVASQGCASGDYCYELTVQLASQNVSASDMMLFVTNGSANVPSPVPQGYAFVGPSGQVLVYSLGSVVTTWTPGSVNATTALSPLDSLWIDMGPSDPTGVGYTLQVAGEGPYAGSGLAFYLP